MTQDIFIGVFLRNQFEKVIEAFDKVVWGIREIIRPGKSNPRKHKPKKPYSMNYIRL